MKFYDVQKHWTKKIEPQLPAANDILVRDFNKFTFGRWKQKFKAGQVPHEFESCDWWCSHKGPMPRYWQYVKHAACHWLVNFNLRLATLVEPKRPWRIVTSDRHSTTWDGDNTLFDLNGLALFDSADHAFETADEEHLPVGEFMEVNFAEHCSVDMRKAQEAQARVQAMREGAGKMLGS